MQNLNLPLSRLLENQNGDGATLTGLEKNLEKKYVSETVIRSVCVDSRKIKAGDWFVCLKGETFDGHDFIENALAAGAAGIVYEKGEVQCPGLRVTDTTLFLGKMAHIWRKIVDPVVIAVTGSNGKTSVKELLAFLLEQIAPGRVCSTSGNFNNQFGVPYTLLTLAPAHKFLVVEIGTNHPGEIAPLSNMAAPDYAVITSISPGHIGNFGSLEAIVEEKTDIVSGCKPGGVLVVNANLGHDAIVRKKVDHGQLTLVTPDDSLSLTGQTTAGGEITLEGKTLTYPPCGLHQFQNLKLAYATLKELEKNPRAGFSHESLKTSLGQLQNFRQAKGRLQRIDNARYNLWDDTYNANPASYAEAIKFIAEVTKTTASSQRFGAFGMMGELGDFALKAHEELGRLTVEFDFKAVFFSADDDKIRNAFLRGRRQALQGSQPAEPETMAGANTDQDILYGFKYLASKMSPGDHLLVKGSRSTRMERILKLF